MGVDRTTCWLLTLFSSSIILFSLDVPANIRPLFFYPWKELRRRYVVRPEAIKMTRPRPITYRLDAWSQYDNPEEGNAREGDILDHPDYRKTATRNEKRLWPGGLVPYFVDETIVNEPAKLAVLGDAMENIMTLTCVKFVRIYPDAKGEFPAHSWVNITGNERGCFADLGRTTLGPSILNLDVKKCFRTRGHSLHEILHTLGVFHEHMRPDRGKYIEILWDNIKEGGAYNFYIMDNDEVTTYGLPYDYDSIMHYSMTAFSKNKSMPTIVPLRKNVVIGQRDHLSIIDVQKLLLAYKCDNVNTEYLAKGQDRSNEVNLQNVDAAISSNVSTDDGTENLGSSINSLQDYQTLHTKQHQKVVPVVRERPYGFCYPEYHPNSS